MSTDKLITLSITRFNIVMREIDYIVNESTSLDTVKQRLTTDLKLLNDLIVESYKGVYDTNDEEHDYEATSSSRLTALNNMLAFIRKARSLESLSTLFYLDDGYDEESEVSNISYLDITIKDSKHWIDLR